jgi:hypothetical protein
VAGVSGHGCVYGSDLMLEICKLSITKSYTHFLYGANLASRSGLNRC